MCLLQVLGADVERGKFRVRRCRAKPPLFHVFDFVIGNEMLGNATDGQGKSLRGTVVSFHRMCMACQRNGKEGGGEEGGLFRAVGAPPDI
jgi:hypothetical protein